MPGLTYLPSSTTQRAKSPGVSHWILAAPSPSAQYRMSFSVLAWSAGVTSRPATTAIHLPFVFRAVHDPRMGKRKVATTVHHRTLLGSRSTTYAYDRPAFDGRPGRTKRFAAFTGIAPFDRKRASITAWVAVFVLLAEAAPWLPWVLVLVSVAVFGYMRLRRPAAVAAVKPAVPVGPAWCDHCADWTVHASDGHAV